MIPLPLADASDPCQPCDAGCCRHVGRPPFTLVWDGPGGRCLTPDWPDFPRWVAAPAELRAAVRTDRLANPHPYGPCVWLGADGRCRGYEFRPDVCREFVPGGPDCMRAFVPRTPDPDGEID